MSCLDFFMGALSEYQKETLATTQRPRTTIALWTTRKPSCSWNLNPQPLLKLPPLALTKIETSSLWQNCNLLLLPKSQKQPPSIVPLKVLAKTATTPFLAYRLFSGGFHHAFWKWLNIIGLGRLMPSFFFKFQFSDVRVLPSNCLLIWANYVILSFF